MARVLAAPMAERFENDGKAGPFQRTVQKAVVESERGKGWQVRDEPTWPLAIAAEGETGIAPSGFVCRRSAINHECGHEQAAALRQDPLDLPQVNENLVRRQMRDDRCHDDEVELPVGKGQLQRFAADLAPWVIKLVCNVESLESEIGIDRGNKAPTPVDAALDRVDPVVASFLGIQILGQRYGHSADAATDVEHAVVCSQTAHANEVTEKFGADGSEIAITDEDALRTRLRQETIVQNGIRQPLDTVFRDWRCRRGRME